MLPLRISGATRRLAEHQDGFTALSIRDEVLHGVRVMTSAWEVTPKEMLALKNGGKLFATYCLGEDNYMPAVLRWPTEDEINRLEKGAAVNLYVPGTLFPPVCIGVTEPGVEHLAPEVQKAVIAVGPVYMEI